MIRAVIALLDLLPCGSSYMEKQARGYYKLPTNVKELIKHIKLRFYYG